MTRRPQRIANEINEPCFCPVTIMHYYATRLPPTHDTIAMHSMTSRIIVLAVAVLPLAGCEAIAITALGGGASAGVSAGISHTLGGTVSRTFTASLPRVRAAALAALQRMHIDVDS